MKKTSKAKYYLELNGKVSFVEKVGRKKIYTPIKGETVLKIIQYALAEGLDLMERDSKAKKASF